MLNVYRASAGSGKTYRLTQDYIHLIFDPKKDNLHRRVLAVTFTNKATDEMKSRILKELHLMATDQKSDYRGGLMEKFYMSEEAVNQRSKKLLTQILHDYSSFSIQTIDTFFQQIIRAFAREIGMNGGYNLELDNQTILTQAIDNLYYDLTKPKNKQLLQWLTEFIEHRIENSEGWDIKSIVFELSQEIFKENYQNKVDETSQKLHDKQFLANYRKSLQEICNRYRSNLKNLATSGLGIIESHGLTVESFKGASRSAMKNLNKIENGIFDPSKTFFEMCADVNNAYSKTTDKNTVSSIENAYSSGLQDTLLAIVNLLQGEANIEYNTAELILKNINTLGILSDIAVQIKEICQEQNLMLISDSNLFLNKIIDNCETPFIYEKTGTHIDHFMIDEFQDTSSLQWKNFFPLITNSLSSGKFNLVVGDVKQSIYRWRNSDWNLLDETIMHQFNPDQIHNENLDVNWRSDKNIIDFNNSFFQLAARLLQNNLNNELDAVLDSLPELNHLTSKITHAYENSIQSHSPKAFEGHVKITFLDHDSDQTWQQESLNRLPSIVEELQDRGYSPKDIAILVRKKSEAKQIVQTLLNYKSSDQAKPNCCYNIMGNEGLLISESGAVKFIVGLMHLLHQPNNGMQQLIVNFEFNKGYKLMDDSDALNQSVTTENLQYGQYSHLFSDEINQKLHSIKHVSLLDIVENIIELFQIGNWKHQTVFVQAFQDVVFRFSNSKSTDLSAFLAWWKKNSNNEFISLPENDNSIQLMTIHKSKGLDFKVVIMPFCNWEMYSKRGVLWCETHQHPFNQISLLPIEFNNGLSKSYFASYYYNELLYQYVDNLNIAYVAFTRAKHELICFTPLSKSQKELSTKTGNLFDILYKICSDSTIQTNSNTVTISQYFDQSTSTFEMGMPTTPIVQANKKDNSHEIKINSYPSVSIDKRLKLKHASQDMWIHNPSISDSNLNYGIIMHDILCAMQYKSDQHNAIQKLLLEGRINCQEVSVIEKQFETFWKLPHTVHWFDSHWKVLNERTILLPGGQQYRPDRVMIKGDNATVIDYKFGENQNEKYIQQIRRYKSILTEMGFQVTAYLCYVTLEIIQEIQ